MRNCKKLLMPAVAAVLFQAPAVVHAATATLNPQANGDIRGGAPDAAFSRIRLAVINDDGTVAGAAKAYLRFQLPADFGTASDATFTISRSDAVSVYDLPYSVFGLNDGVTGETSWTEADTYSPGPTDLTWNNAPGNNPSSVSSFVNATQVGSFTATGSNNGGLAGETESVSGAPLVSFLNADSNGFITLMISQAADQITSSENQFASDSSPTYAIPSLQLTYTTVVPFTWKSNSGDWNTGSNWTNKVVPNAPDAVAIFSGAIGSPQTVYTNSGVTVGSMTFDNANTYVIAGAGSLTIAVSSGNASISVLQGSHKINLPLTFASNTAITVASGATLTIGNPTTINANTTVTKAGNVLIQAPLTIQSGGVLQVASGSTGLFGAPSLGTGAKVDVMSNALTIDYHGLSTPAATVQSQLTSGFAGGAWNGSGIDTSSATSHTGLGWKDDTANKSVLVKYTYYGDANLDGQVTTADFTALATSFNTTGGTWVQGDFNYDGVVNALDFNAIATNFGQTPISGAALSAIGTLVPEPATLSVIMLGLAGLSSRRRRR